MKKYFLQSKAQLRIFVRKYSMVVSIVLGELWASPANFIGNLMIHAIRIFVFGVVYTYVYTSSGQVQLNGMTVLKVIWSLALIQLIYQSSRNTFRQMRDEIIHGQVEVKLNKPYSFIVFSFLEAVGQTPVKFPAVLLVTTVVLGLFFGLPTVDGLFLVSFIVLYLLGIILFTLFQQLIALFGFWLENPDPIFWITSKMSWIVNGTFLPVAILPLVFRQVSNVFPLSAPFYLGRIFEIQNWVDLGKFAGMQLFWIVIFILAVRLVYRKGITKISLNGG